MIIISFQLTMPNVGSWNGKWSGADKKYYVIRKFSDRYMKSKEHLQELLDLNKMSWYYSFGDGWGASVHAEIIDSREAAKRRRVSAGFCGYDWMIDTILQYGKILSSVQKEAL